MPETETKLVAGHDKTQKGGAALALGNAVATAEEAAIDLGTNRIYRLQARHPYLYGLAAFILGGGIVSIFTMTTYVNWTYEGVNLTRAVYQVVLGGLGGGIVFVILAFAYARSVKPTLGTMESNIGRSPRQNVIP
jgi:hypothetical protein